MGWLDSTFPEQGQFQALRELSMLSCPTACLNEIWPYHLLNFRSLWGLNEAIRVGFQILSKTNSLTKLITALATRFLSVLPAGGELEWAGHSIPRSSRCFESIMAAADLGQNTVPIPDLLLTHADQSKHFNLYRLQCPLPAQSLIIPPIPGLLKGTTGWETRLTVN